MLLSNLGSRLGSAFRGILNNIPRLQVPRFSNDGSILGGIMEGRAYATNEQITNQAMKEHAEELAKAKAEDEMMRRSLFGNGNKNKTTPQFNIGEGISVGSWQPSQLQNSNPFGIDTSGWGNVSGNSIGANTQGLFGTQPQGQVSWNSLLGGGKSFNEPSADNPLAQAVEGLGINPNYMSIMSNGLMTPLQLQEFNEKMNLRQWLEWDAKMNGVTDPLIALARYNKFMPIMQKQAELEELRNAYYIMNSDPNDKRFTPEQRLNARTLVEFDKKNPYYVDDHDMNVERFNWAKQNFNNQQALFPYQLKSAQLGTLLQRQQLDANELANTGEYAGVNLEGDSWYRKNDGVDLSNLQGRALAGLNHASVIFKSMFGEPLMVTSGRDSDAHMGGQYSHYTGWKVDVSSGMNSKRLEDPQERAKFIQALGSVGIIVNDEWAKDKHLDLNFQNYHGNYTKNRNRNLNKNGLSNRSSSNSKNKNSSSSLHSALENLADVSNEFNPEMDMNSKDGQNYKKKYNNAFQDVKNQLNETYPGLGEWIKKQVQQGKSSEDICMEISGAIRQDINTNLPDSKIADVVEELMLDYDNRVKRKQVAPNVAKRMNIKSHTSFTDKLGRSGSVYLGEPEFNRYAGMTDEDIRTQNADRTYDGYAKSISSQARLLGNKEFEERRK